MRWKSQLSKSVIHDAWETWNTHFRKTLWPSVDLATFNKLVTEAQVKSMKISDLIKAPPDNMSIFRLKANTPEEAYPLFDRPRGQEDISSIKWFMTTKTLISPIVFIKVKNKLILLDGMHRLVASKLTGDQSIKAVVLNNRLINK